MAIGKDTRYTKHAIKNGSFSTEELIDEYSRLRRIKNRRLSLLEKSFPKAQVVKENTRAPRIQDLLDERGEIDINKLSSEMQDAYKFAKSKSTTVTGYKKQLKKAIKSFNKLFPKGMNPINEDNIFDLFDFLEDYRNKYNVQKIPDSDRVIDAWQHGTQVLNMDAKSLLSNIDYWGKHYEDMQKLKPAIDENGNVIKGVSSEWYRRQLENLENQ